MNPTHVSLQSPALFRLEVFEFEEKHTISCNVEPRFVF